MLSVQMCKFKSIRSIVINPKNSDELKFLQDLLTKLGVESKTLSQEDMEDLGLAMLMKDTDRQDRVSEAEVIKKLN
jgi:hypothetical protein